ncbi:hypothetical protein EV356DRAFT_538167 [Viridothelium virens]|uniref:Uncharacterized protein n=1 Tax=Viridothelium virens TaxID=1048519 RepID=A0A6A6GRN4_VIRVR|nr:hypothetical protein EV356DRAFT_538167 [Viridothelium virens]
MQLREGRNILSVLRKEAISSPQRKEWQEAINAEINIIQINKTYKKVFIPININILRG